MSACLRPTAPFSALRASSRRPVAACPARAASRRNAVLVRAAFQPPEGPLASAVDRFFRRYDVVSTGLGALAVTSFCVSRGQDPWTALSITFTSTVVALVLNEALSNNESSSSS